MPRITAAKMLRSNWSPVDWCPGCGSLTLEHRPDCTAQPSPLLCGVGDCDALRLPSEPKTPAWGYDPRTKEYHCPTHQKGTT